MRIQGQQRTWVYSNPRRYWLTCIVWMPLVLLGSAMLWTGTLIGFGRTAAREIMRDINL